MWCQVSWIKVQRGRGSSVYMCVVLNRVFREDYTDKGHLRKGQEEDRVGCLGKGDPGREEADAYGLCGAFLVCLRPARGLIRRQQNN